jgi:quinol monooxygenase YgiN
MILVTGRLYVEPAERERFLAGTEEVSRLAREAPGCLDFHLSADPLEPGRVNVFEQWDSVAAVEAFRGDGPSDEQATAILSAEVWQHEVASSVRL